MNIIYEPKGKAREYASLAVNLYSGCAHGCTYCFGPSTLKKNRQVFNSRVATKENALKRLKEDARKLRGDNRELLLSFVKDPYQPIEMELKITRQAIKILIENDLRFIILSIGGTRVERDFDLLEDYSNAFSVQGINAYFNSIIGVVQRKAPIARCVRTERRTNSYRERPGVMKINFKETTIQNLTINQFSSGAIDTGPLTEIITIRCSKKFMELINLVCKLTDREVSELGHRYLLQGMTRDIKDIFSMEPYLDRTLREVLKR